VQGDCIRCRYHGWKYDGAGQCVEQPGEDQSFAEKVKIRSYPTREYLGLIFAYLGEGEPPAFRRLPDLELPGLLQVGPPEIWPCNYYNRLDNSLDHVHVSFTHGESLDRIGRGDLYPDVPKIVPEETDYGLRIAGIFPDRKQYSFFHMPNSSQLRIPARIEGSLEDAANLWTDRVFWYVPIDDTNCVAFIVDRILLGEKEAKEYEQRRGQTRASVTVSPNEIGEKVLKGEMRIEDIPADIPPYYVFWVEDYATLVGQGAIADRSQDTLGRVDLAQVLLRKIWERELRALAGRRPLKQWVSPSPGLAELTDLPAEVRKPLGHATRSSFETS
jgi:5,5'-dehydrodivanillate O-demethylase